MNSTNIGKNLWSVYVVYECKESPTIEFIETEYKLNTLYKYFQYTKRFVKAYEKEAETYYKEQQEEIKKYQKTTDFWLYDYSEDLAGIGDLQCCNSESILIMLYRLFEKFLRSVVAVIDKSAKELYIPEDDFVVVEYMKFLKRNNIFVPKSLFRKYDEIRLVRNYLVHSSERMSKKLSNYLKEDKYGIIKKWGMELNFEYVDNAFFVFGEIVKSVEIAFSKNH